MRRDGHRGSDSTSFLPELAHSRLTDGETSQFSDMAVCKCADQAFHSGKGSDNHSNMEHTLTTETMAECTAVSSPSFCFLVHDGLRQFFFGGWGGVGERLCTKLTTTLCKQPEKKKNHYKHIHHLLPIFLIWVSKCVYIYISLYHILEEYDYIC